MNMPCHAIGFLDYTLKELNFGRFSVWDITDVGVGFPNPYSLGKGSNGRGELAPTHTQTHDDFSTHFTGARHSGKNEAASQPHCTA